MYVAARNIKLGDPWLPAPNAEPYVARKTPEQWFTEALPEWIAELAIANIDRDFETYVSHPRTAGKALDYSFDWDETKERELFWYTVYKASEGEGDFPPNLAKKRYWSGAQDLPDWGIWLAHVDAPSRKRRVVDVQECSFFCGQAPGRFLWTDISNFRWSYSAKTPWEEMNECLVERGNDE